MSGTNNPLWAFVEDRVLGTLLKTGSTSSYYTVLHLDNQRKFTVDDAAINRAYKKECLKLHPDKIAQLYKRSPTAEEKESLLYLKKAYNVLINPARRKRYDKYGDKGLSLLEGDLLQEKGLQECMMQILKNYKSNTTDRMFLLILLVVILGIFISVPIVLCLKIDSTDILWVNGVAPESSGKYNTVCMYVLFLQYCLSRYIFLLCSSLLFLISYSILTFHLHTLIKILTQLTLMII